MLYNKNIIMDILQRNFWDEIESNVEKCVMRMKDSEIESIFNYEYSIDFAMVDCIEEMDIQDWNAEESQWEKGTQTVSGTLDILAQIEGYKYWDGEHIPVGTAGINIGFFFQFECQGKEKFDNLELEHIY